MAALVTELLHPDTARFPRAVLTVAKGPDRGREVVLEGQTVVVGTDPACQLVLTDSSVSRRHFELSGGPGGYRLRDLRSTNGVFVEGAQVLEGRLTGKVRLLAGRTELRFEPARHQVEWPLSPSERFGEAVGVSAPMRRAFAVLEKAAQSDASVLFEGEPGTGKELLARQVHRGGRRAAAPFVVADLSLPVSALDERLFSRSGLMEEADGGTVFFDQVDQLALPLQGKLIHALEGSMPPDVRLMGSATSDLEARVRAGTFREDLYFRLATFRVHLPPLRERPEDVPLLARHFEAKLGAPRPISAEHVEMLARHPFGGNVRELRTVVERLAAFPDLGAAALTAALAEAEGGDGVALQREQLKRLLGLPFHEARDRVVEAFERQYLTEHLRVSRGVVTHAAQRVGLPRQSLHRMLRKLGLSSGDDEGR